MARMMDDVLLPLGRATPTLAVGDDEIAVHAEALEDGRDAPATGLWGPADLRDDEIASHLELEEMLFEGRPSRRTGRRPVRH